MLLCIYLNRWGDFKIVQQIIQIQANFKDLQSNSLRIRYRISVAVIIFLALNTCSAFLIQHTFEAFHAELSSLTKKNKKLNKWSIMEILHNRSDLITLSIDDVNWIYGITMALITAQLFILGWKENNFGFYK